MADDAKAMVQAAAGARLNRPGSEPTVNDPYMFKLGMDTAEKAFGEGSTLNLEHSSMAGEDFALFSLGVPGSMFWIGSKSEEHEPYVRTGNNLHNANFEVDDRMVPRGAAFLSTAAIEYLKQYKSGTVESGTKSEEL